MIEYFGWFCLSLLTLTLAMFATGAAAYGIERLLHWIKSNGKRDAEREVGNHIEASAHWFSEDEGVYNALKLIGAAYKRQGTFDADTIRQDWRGTAHKTKFTACTMKIYFEGSIMVIDLVTPQGVQVFRDRTSLRDGRTYELKNLAIELTCSSH